MIAGPHRRVTLAVGGILLCLAAAPGIAAQTCLEPPWSGGADELYRLAGRALSVVADYPSLQRALETEAPFLCLDDTLVEEQGYFAPKTRQIVLRQGIDPDMQLAVLMHELRHLEQFSRDICPAVELTLVDYVRTRQALEADAAAISLLIAWDLRAAGDPGPWEALAHYPTHDDLATRFGAEMDASGDGAKATAAAYAAWFDDPERREIYAFVSCVNYLDALDRTKVEPGTATVAADFVTSLCRLPDGRPYDCTLPP
jgi:hypothetical protein